MFNVRDKVYYYSEAQDRYYPAVVLAINVDEKLYVIKYWGENNNWHLVNDVASEDVTYRHHTETIEEENKDMVNNPKHYTQGKIEVIEAIEDWDMNFCLGNAIKYIARCNHKGNKKQDLEKAIWYIKRELGE